MSKYKTLYRWMLLPMVVMQLGIFKDYWGDFSGKCMVGSYTLLDGYCLVHLSYHSTLVCYTWPNGQAQNQWYHRHVYSRRCLPYCAEYDEQRHGDCPKSFGSSGAIRAISTLVLLWCSRCGNCNDDSLWICSDKKYHSQKRNRKPCM